MKTLPLVALTLALVACGEPMQAVDATDEDATTEICETVVTPYTPTIVDGERYARGMSCDLYAPDCIDVGDLAEVVVTHPCETPPVVLWHEDCTGQGLWEAHDVCPFIEDLTCDDVVCATWEQWYHTTAAELLDRQP